MYRWAQTSSLKVRTHRRRMVSGLKTLLRSSIQLMKAFSTAQRPASSTLGQWMRFRYLGLDASMQMANHPVQRSQRVNPANTVSLQSSTLFKPSSWLCMILLTETRFPPLFRNQRIGSLRYILVPATSASFTDAKRIWIYENTATLMLLLARVPLHPAACTTMR